MMNHLNKNSWIVVGNASKQIPLGALPNSIAVGFNQPAYGTLKYDILIQNQRVSSQSLPIAVTGDLATEDLTTQLLQNANKLAFQLGVWPSLGLIAIHTGMQLGLNLHVRNMDLLPKIARSHTLNPRKPLPCTYHNWLAERRTIFPIIGQLDWPSFHLKPINYPERHISLESCELVEMLIRLPILERDLARKSMDLLSQLHPADWLMAMKQTTDTEIAAIDQLFCLSREHQITPNWWLYPTFRS